MLHGTGAKDDIAYLHLFAGSACDTAVDDRRRAVLIDDVLRGHGGVHFANPAAANDNRLPAQVAGGER